MDCGAERRLIALLGALVAFGPLSIDLYLPALPAIAAGLRASAEAIQLSVTIFLAGFTAGMLLYGPLSDRYGRRPVMLGGILLFTLASLACVLVGAAGQLLVARFFQALGGGAASVLARAVVRDLFAPLEAIRRLSMMAMVTAIAPLLAPLIGSSILLWFGWRGEFGVLLLWGALSLLVVWRFLPESLPAERRGQMTLGQAFYAYRQILGDAGAIGLMLAGGMSFAAMFAYITGSPFVLIELHGLSPTIYGLIFASNAVGIFAANFFNSRLVRRHGAAQMARGGALAGLAAALLLGVTISTGLFGLAGLIVPLFVVVSVTGLLGANCVGLLMSRFPHNAGAAAALFGASQFGFGTLASVGVSLAYDGSGQPMVWAILAASALSLAGYLLYARQPTPAVGQG
jgi:DHA1 family bicyclomycin/chloramphenicol resistance-like MFS transporter